jgi:N-carbamoyl-L-amino-acid hydrolase
MIAIQPERLLRDLRHAADFGRHLTGVHRPTFSPQDMEARRWLATLMGEAGLDADIDGAGNVIGRAPIEGRRLLLGSHSESQNHAGWLDGILGVLYGIETVRALREASVEARVDVGSWADEEGHFLQFFGSRSFAGGLREEEIDRAANKDDGTPLRTALREVGLDGRARAEMRATDYVGYLEAHIEQGDYLDSAGLQIGIVTSIVGLWQYRLTFAGEQNHAGSTRMAARKDAGAALVRLAAMIQERFPEIARERSVWTIGKIELDPGASSIIPGGAEMLFQFRDDDVAQLRRFEDALEAIVAELNQAGPCVCQLAVLSKTDPQRMAPAFQEIIEKAAEAHASGRHVRMPSGAGHDAQIFAARMPAGMLFVPSIGGISHHHAEDTKEEDIVIGCRVFADAAEMILEGIS